VTDVQEEEEEEKEMTCVEMLTLPQDLQDI